LLEKVQDFVRHLHLKRFNQFTYHLVVVAVHVADDLVQYLDLREVKGRVEIKKEGDVLLIHLLILCGMEFGVNFYNNSICQYLNHLIGVLGFWGFGVLGFWGL